MEGGPATSHRSEGAHNSDRQASNDSLAKMAEIARARYLSNRYLSNSDWEAPSCNP